MVRHHERRLARYKLMSGRRTGPRMPLAPAVDAETDANTKKF